MNVRDQIAELQERGFCVLKSHLQPERVAACAEAFWAIFQEYLDVHSEKPNRGPHRHFLAMPFDPPCFAPEFFFDPVILSVVHAVLDDRAVADQWGCDVPLLGSQYQQLHVDYERPLFPERPDSLLPPYMLLISFGLVPITSANGPIEIAPGTHRLPKREAEHAVQSGAIPLQTVPLGLGDVLLRHPWALHRGTPNTTAAPRALLSVRYVRRWYADQSRHVRQIPRSVWLTLTPAQQAILRFPVEQ